MILGTRKGYGLTVKCLCVKVRKGGFVMAHLGCHLDIPGKRKPQLKNCPHQTSCRPVY